MQTWNTAVPHPTAYHGPSFRESKQPIPLSMFNKGIAITPSLPPAKESYSNDIDNDITRYDNDYDM